MDARNEKEGYFMIRIEIVFINIILFLSFIIKLMINIFSRLFIFTYNNINNHPNNLNNEWK